MKNDFLVNTEDIPLIALFIAKELMENKISNGLEKAVVETISIFKYRQEPREESKETVSRVMKYYQKLQEEGLLSKAKNKNLKQVNAMRKTLEETEKEIKYAAALIQGEKNE
jgi:hypothetical protein